MREQIAEIIREEVRDMDIDGRDRSDQKAEKIMALIPEMTAEWVDSIWEKFPSSRPDRDFAQFLADEWNKKIKGE